MSASSCTNNRTPLDIVIVESRSDLNVYTSTNDDGTTKAKTNACCKGEPVSTWSCSDACCARQDPPTKSCYSSTDNPEELNEGVAGIGTAGCCSKTVESGLNLADLNKWAGSFKIYAVKP
jgi:arsenite methyltransferase